MMKSCYALLLATAINALPERPHHRRPDLYQEAPQEELKLRGTHTIKDLEEAMTPFEAGLHPKLKKFQESIYWDVQYTDSALYDYIEAFYVGFQFDKYNKGQQCFQESAWCFNTAFGFNEQMTTRFNFRQPITYASQELATHCNNFWYDCWQFQKDFWEVYEEKRDGFVDAPDVYLSFIFNLLGNSFQIKTAAENLILAQNTHDMVLFFQELGFIMQIMYDFESYKTTAASLIDFTQKAALKDDEFIKGFEAKEVRAEKKLQEARQKQKELEQEWAENPEKKRLRTGEGYTWQWTDAISAPFALVVGGLNSLGETSSSSYCSRYILSARQTRFDALPYLEAENYLDGYFYIWRSYQYTDNIAIACYNSYEQDIDAEHFEEIFSAWWYIPVNLLYNFGFMWVDIINYYFYNYQTVPQQDWAFFFFFLVGDFISRFLFNASDGTANLIVPDTTIIV